MATMQLFVSRPSSSSSAVISVPADCEVSHLMQQIEDIEGDSHTPQLISRMPSHCLASIDSSTTQSHPLSRSHSGMLAHSDILMDVQSQSHSSSPALLALHRVDSSRFLMTAGSL